jgi:hypothetical protein
MANALLMVLLCVLPVTVMADGKAATKDYCHDQADKQAFDDLLGKYPTDTGIIRLLATRHGLCEMVGKQQIPLETGIDLWAAERQKILMERTKSGLNRLTKKAL